MVHCADVMMNYICEWKVYYEIVQITIKAQYVKVWVIYLVALWTDESKLFCVISVMFLYVAFSVIASVCKKLLFP